MPIAVNQLRSGELGVADPIPFAAYLSSRLGTFSQHAPAADDDLRADFEECGPGDDVIDASSTKPTCKLCDQGCCAVELLCRSVQTL